MKHGLIVAVLLILNSCSHAYIREWKEDQVTACCPKKAWACSTEKLDEMAGQKCGSKVKAIGGGTVDSGGEMVVYGNFGSMNATRDECITYECDRSPASK